MEKQSTNDGVTRERFKEMPWIKMDCPLTKVSARGCHMEVNHEFLTFIAFHAIRVKAGEV